MPDTNQSRARKLVAELQPMLQTLVDDAATVRTFWHPSFASKSELADPLVTVRPAKRGRTADGVVTGPRDVDIEIAVVQALPQPASRDADPFNDNETIDHLDYVAELIFDAFCRVDPDVYPAPAGSLADIPICGFTSKTPEQPTTIDNALLESDRVFLTVITVPFQRME